MPSTALLFSRVLRAPSDQVRAMAASGSAQHPQRAQEGQDRVAVPAASAKPLETQLETLSGKSKKQMIAGKGKGGAPASAPYSTGKGRGAGENPNSREIDIAISATQATGPETNVATLASASDTPTRESAMEEVPSAQPDPASHVNADTLPETPERLDSQTSMAGAVAPTPIVVPVSSPETQSDTQRLTSDSQETKDFSVLYITSENRVGMLLETKAAIWPQCAQNSDITKYTHNKIYNSRWWNLRREMRYIHAPQTTPDATLSETYQYHRKRRLKTKSKSLTAKVRTLKEQKSEDFEKPKASTANVKTLRRQTSEDFEKSKPLTEKVRTWKRQTSEDFEKSKKGKHKQLYRHNYRYHTNYKYLNYKHSTAVMRCRTRGSISDFTRDPFAHHRRQAGVTTHFPSMLKSCFCLLLVGTGCTKVVTMCKGTSSPLRLFRRFSFHSGMLKRCHCRSESRQATDQGLFLTDRPASRQATDQRLPLSIDRWCYRSCRIGLPATLRETSQLPKRRIIQRVKTAVVTKRNHSHRVCFLQFVVLKAKFVCSNSMFRSFQA